MFCKNFILILLLGLTNLHTICCTTRVYYVAIEEVVWDYAPSGRILKSGALLDDDEDASVFTRSGIGRIGRVYKKAVFREYEDSTFNTPSPREEHWGIIGPPLRAEVGDVMEVHVKNKAFRDYSMHPHGVLYNKTHEGAVYHDKVADVDKQGVKIAPGDTFIYHWDVTESFGPTKDDPDCTTWAYHSHVESPKDTNSGLIGPMLICKQGSLMANGKRRDVDAEMLLLFTVLDENDSWYLDQNIQSYALDPDSVDKDDEDFQESNKMHGINGFMYGNLRGLSACYGDRIGIHLFGLGTEVDLHTVHFKGQTIITQGHRQDTMNVFPGIFSTGVMVADNIGQFKILCEVNDHLSAGMSSMFTVKKCESEQKLFDVTGTIREFFIGIVEEDWDYGPHGVDTLGNNLTAEGSDSKTFFEQGADRIGGVYKKAIYYGYESNEFINKINKPSSFGILGPLIALEVGDTVHVTLKNFANEQTYNIEPHGVHYTDVTALGPGQTHTYEWTVPESVSPTALDSDCITYLYISSVQPAKDTNSGLVGPILLCRRGTLARNMERRAEYLLLTVFDENLSHYLDENIGRFASDPDSVDKEDGDFQESNLMHAINGLMYGSLEVNFCQHLETDIHVIGLGTEVDMHSLFIDGQIYTYRNEWANVINVLPHTTASTTVKPHSLGSGDLLCGVMDHFVGGMFTRYSVVDCGIQYEEDGYESDGITRTYYVAAVDEVWDYMPWKEDNLDHDLSAFTERKNGSLIGTKYWKAIYHEYTDNTFTTRIKKSLHLGYLGPVIKGEEGDKIKIIFRNMARQTYNVVPWGLYPEGLLQRGVESAAPGETVTYIWDIPKLAVPAENQPACNGHVYVSAVDPVGDIYTGLLGPLLICRKGGISSNGWMQNADAEFFLSFLVTDESGSHYLDQNIRQFTGSDPDSFDKKNEDFVESNLMHSINGRLDHLEGLEMHEGDRVIWHLIGIGNEDDIHTVHFHAHAYNYTSDTMRHEDVFNLFPGKMGTVEMVTDNVGKWLLHCHVNDHMTAGMSTTYTVLPKEDKKLNRLPCTAHRRWRGVNKFQLHCVFENPITLRRLVEDESNRIEVCLSSLKNVHLPACRYHDTKVIMLSKIFSLNVSTDFNMEAKDFKDFVSLFSGLRYVYANDIGLRFLSPNTFAKTKLLIRIILKENTIKNIPAGLLNGMTRLRLVDLQNNDLESGVENLIDDFVGVRGQFNLRNNPKLGKMQKVYRSASKKSS